MQETWVQTLGQEDPWRREWQPTPLFLLGESHGWTEEPGRLRSMGSQRVGHDEATNTHTHTHTHTHTLSGMSLGIEQAHNSSWSIDWVQGLVSGSLSSLAIAYWIRTTRMSLQTFRPPSIHVLGASSPPFCLGQTCLSPPSVSASGPTAIRAGIRMSACCWSRPHPQLHRQLLLSRCPHFRGNGSSLWRALFPVTPAILQNWQGLSLHLTLCHRLSTWGLSDLSSSLVSRRLQLELPRLPPHWSHNPLPLISQLSPWHWATLTALRGPSVLRRRWK